MRWKLPPLLLPLDLGSTDLHVRTLRLHGQPVLIALFSAIHTPGKSAHVALGQLGALGLSCSVSQGPCHPHLCRRSTGKPSSVGRGSCVGLPQAA